MTKARVRPYRTVRDQHAPVVTWARVAGEALVPLVADDWDPATDLHIRASLELDVPAILYDSHLTTEEAVCGCVRVF